MASLIIRDDNLARTLQERAQARNLTVEEFLQTLLAEPAQDNALLRMAEYMREQYQNGTITVIRDDVTGQNADDILHEEFGQDLIHRHKRDTHGFS